MKSIKKTIFSFFLCSSLILCSRGIIYAQVTTEEDSMHIEEGENSDGITEHFTMVCEGEDTEQEDNISTAIYIPNELGGSLTPTSTGFVIIFDNIGVDRISSVSFTLKVYNYAGGLVASKSDTLTNLKVGSTKYTWTVAKSNSVYETVELYVTGIDGGEKYVGSTSTVRYNFAGGKYGTMQAWGGQKHHMPSSKALTSTGVLSTYNGACIRMITADHYQTASYGSSATAVSFRNKEITQINNGKFLAAQQLGISDIQSLFGTKYNTAINEMVSYTKGLGFTK